MSNKEKLIQYINNLTNEEAEEIISYLETVPSSAIGIPLPLPSNSPQEQTI